MLALHSKRISASTSINAGRFLQHKVPRLKLVPPPPTPRPTTTGRPLTPPRSERADTINGAFELHSRTTTIFRTSAAPQLIFLGPPGVGKGTFASRLCEKWRIPHISTGDIIRHEIAKRTPEGEAFKQISDKGDLVPDDLVIAIVENRLDEPDTEGGFILDGFPRTQYQAEALDSFSGPFLAVDLSQPISILVAKLSGRRVCKVCKSTYNVTRIVQDGYEFEPLVPTEEEKLKCSGCNSLTQRMDDQEAIILKRLEIYERETTPLKAYYQQKGMLEQFEVLRGVKDFDRFEKSVKDAGRKRRLFYRP